MLKLTEIISKFLLKAPLWWQIFSMWTGLYGFYTRKMAALYNHFVQLSGFFCVNQISDVI